MQAGYSLEALKDAGFALRDLKQAGSLQALTTLCFLERVEANTP